MNRAVSTPLSANCIISSILGLFLLTDIFPGYMGHIFPFIGLSSHFSLGARHCVFKLLNLCILLSTSRVLDFIPAGS